MLSCLLCFFVAMKFFRPLVVLVLVAILIGALWLWWSIPAPVDMANYAPADALVYVEFNNLADVVQAIQHSKVWQSAAPLTHSNAASQSRIITTAARAGVGPLPAVLFARAQVALVVVGLNTSEEQDTLKVRPEVAIIAETHTSKWRTRHAAVEAVKQLASFAYGASMCSERSGDADYFECSVAGGDRKILGAVDGTLIVIGNSDAAVSSCLEARRGVRPSMRTDPEMLKVRSSLTSEKSLGFGYISPSNSAKLFSWAAPLLMGQAPGDAQLEQLLAVSAGKVLRGVAWTATPAPQGIEDRFLFSLESGVVERLRPAFSQAPADERFWSLVPEGFQSLTIYRNREPAAAWSSLDAAVSLKLDALPAVLFGSLLRSSLSVYGINNPKEVLTTLSPPLLTLKPSEGADGSILVARVSDEDGLRRSLTQEVFKDDKGEILQGLKSNPNSEKEFTAVFADGHVLIGKTENVRAGLEALRKNVEADAKKYMVLSPNESSAAIISFANDEARLNNFITTVLELQGRKLSREEVESLRKTVHGYGFSATATSLNAFGIQRTTRSAFGQFGTFVSMLQSDHTAR